MIKRLPSLFKGIHEYEVYGSRYSVRLSGSGNRYNIYEFVDGAYLKRDTLSAPGYIGALRTYLTKIEND